MKKFIAQLLLREAIKLRKQFFGLNHLDKNLGFGHSQSKTITLSNPDLIESTIDGPFTGFNGATTISLANGQKWQQVDATVASYSADSSNAANVTIRKQDAVWVMKVDGVSKEVRVARLQ